MLFYFFDIYLQANVIAYEYQGYGISEGPASADSCVADHITVLKFMLEILKIPPKNIIVFGRSIGMRLNIAFWIFLILIV